MTGTLLTSRSGRRCMPCAIGSAPKTRSIWLHSCRCCCAASTTRAGGWQPPRPRSGLGPTSSSTYGASCRAAAAIDPNVAARAVFGVMWAKLDLGEVGKVIDRLPEELKELWR